MRIPIVHTNEGPLDEYVASFQDLRIMVDAMTVEGREDEIDPNWLIKLDGLQDDSLGSETHHALTDRP